MQLITGNTYPVRHELSALGAHWSPIEKGWQVPDERAAEARAIVENAPRRQALRRRYSGGPSIVTRFAGGGEVYRNARGRCEDAPCCGCCS